MIDIYKASAGSGKTHTLTGEYLKRLFSANDAYRHILAVTFTNKATEEMKSRILEELYKLASGSNSDYSAQLQSTAGGNGMLQHRAKKVLCQILHDYSLFNVSTIDRFFQSVMRSFARDLGRGAAYGVELDEESIRAEAVDRLYSRLANNSKLLDWMTQFSLDAVEDDKGWNIKESIMELSKEVNSEKFRLLSKDLGQLPTNEFVKNVEQLKNDMRRIKESFITQIEQLGEEALYEMGKKHRVPEDYKGGARSYFCYFKKMSKGICKAEYADIFERLYDNEDNWVKSEFRGNTDYCFKELNECLLKSAKFIRNNYDSYATAEAVLKHTNELGILGEIYKQMLEICKEKNVMLISETTELLNRIIDGNDTPFIYEKIGTKLDSLMLDEFQDTSQMQWENFKPLLDEVESRTTSGSAAGNMVVGDIKQSIYRWRNSDWRILFEGISNQFGKKKCNEIQLKDNWRSLKSVIEFNNGFFSYLACALDSKLSGGTNTKGIISEIYNSVAQTYPAAKASKGEQDGYVEVRSVPNEDAALPALIDIIKDVTKRGYDYGDITILVRKNKEGAVVANSLLAAGLPVVSNDSMLLISSNAVVSVVETLKSIYDGTDTIYSGEQRNKPLAELCQMIIHNLGDDSKNDMAYLQAFMDVVLRYSATEGGNLNLFLKWWEEKSESLSISAPNGNAISIMTIHKSKGLEAKVVIIPFFVFALEPQVRNILWCKSDILVNNCKTTYSGPIPVVYGKALENTLFEGFYREEQKNNYIDAINLAYVACTRARNELYLFVPKERHTAVKNNSVAAFLEEYVKDKSSFGTKTQCQSGTADDAQNQLSANPQELLSKIQIDGKFKLAAVQSSVNEGENSVRNKGVALHYLFSLIEQREDIANAVLRAKREGILDKRDLDGIFPESTLGEEAIVERLIAQTENYKWFSGNARVLNECEILSPEGKVTRPDRVMLLPDANGAEHAVVVDYKFGEFDENSSILTHYKWQVAGYMKSLRNMGYGKVSGYLWYPIAGKIVEVVPKALYRGVPWKTEDSSQGTSLP